MKKPKYVIFDCDGVLIDSELLANRVEVEVKNRLGFPITLEEQIAKFVGQSMTNPVMLEEIARLPADYMKQVDDQLEIVYREELAPIAGVVDLLRDFPLPKAVASNSDPESLRSKMRLTKLVNYFHEDHLFSGHQVKKSKPEPDLFLFTAAKMGWPIDECLVIEDSVAGVTAGKAAGMTVCAFVGGGHIYPGHAEKLLKAGADFVVPHIRNILRLL